MSRGVRPPWCAPAEWGGRRGPDARADAIEELLARRWWVVPADVPVFDAAGAAAFLGERARDGRN
jgi:hypothetical protein